MLSLTKVTPSITSTLSFLCASGLNPVTDGRGSGSPTHGDVITCLEGSTLKGKDYWFDGKTQTWIECQSKSSANSSVKFELYDTTFHPLSEYNETDFLGNTVLEYLEDKLAKWWMPDDVVFVDEIPHTATGKIQKLTLREQFADYELPTA